MKNREPYKLKTFMAIYNVYQLWACFYMVGKILEDEHAPPTQYFSKCQHGEPFRKPSDLYRFSCFLYCLKVSEMSETVVFVLRKKWNQISFLHVFHHSAMVLLIFLGAHSGSSKFYEPSLVYSYNCFFISVRGAFIALLINAIVHIVMYSYYLAAAVLSRDMLTLISPMKRYITIMQMIQFSIILSYLAIHRLWYKCQYNDVFHGIFFAAVAVMFYSFYDFYQKSYNKKGSKAVPKTSNINNTCALNEAN